MNTDVGVQIDLVGGLRRRMLLAGVVATVVFLVTYWVAMALPNQYAAYATLLIEPQQVTETAGGTSFRSSSDVNDRLHLMTATLLSRPRLSRVIDQLGLYEVESKSMTRQEIIDLMREKVGVAPVLPELEAGLRLPNRDIEINTFRIHFVSENPVTAAAVAQRLANDFIEEHISQRVKLTQKSLDFISTEQTRLAEVIRQVDEQIASTKEENPGKLPEDLQAHHRQLDRVMVRLANAERELDVARSDASFYQSQSIEAGALGNPNDDTSPSRRLSALELQLSALRASGLTEKHPDVIRTEAEIAELKQQLASAATDGPAEGQPASLAQRQMRAEKERALLKVAMAEHEITRLQAEADELRVGIDEMPRITDKLDALEQRRAELTDNLREYNKRQLETNTLANLERKQLGEQFRIIEPAYPPTEPDSPNRIVILIVGLVMGLSLGVASAVVAEATDTSLHSARDLQAALGVPVLVSIPSIMLESDRRLRRRQRVRRFAAAAVVVLFCLVGGAITNRWVNQPPSELAAPEADDSATVAPGLFDRLTG